jgi:hypothetical protein
MAHNSVDIDVLALQETVRDDSRSGLSLRRCGAVTWTMPDLAGFHAQGRGGFTS